MTNLLRAIACLVVFALPSAARAQDAVSLTGLWNLSVTSPQGVTPVAMAVADEAGKLSGILSSARGQTPVDGARTTDGVTLRFSVMYEGAPLPIVLTAPAAGETLSGTADFGGQASGTWTGTKAAPTGINGAWTFYADDGSGSRTPGHLTLLDADGKVSGRLLVPSRGVSGVLGGTHTDGALNMNVDATVNGSPMSIDLPGKVSGDGLAGTYAVGDRTGRWTATRP